MYYTTCSIIELDQLSTLAFFQYFPIHWMQSAFSNYAFILQLFNNYWWTEWRSYDLIKINDYFGSDAASSNTIGTLNSKRRLSTKHSNRLQWLCITNITKHHLTLTTATSTTTFLQVLWHIHCDYNIRKFGDKIEHVQNRALFGGLKLCRILSNVTWADW